MNLEPGPSPGIGLVLFREAAFAKVKRLLGGRNPPERHWRFALTAAIIAVEEPRLGSFAAVASIRGSKIHRASSMSALTTRAQAEKNLGVSAPRFDSSLGFGFVSFAGTEANIAYLWPFCNRKSATASIENVKSGYLYPVFSQFVLARHFSQSGAIPWPKRVLTYRRSEEAANVRKPQRIRRSQALELGDGRQNRGKAS